MHLDPDLTDERNGRVLLHVVKRRHAVDPRPDRWAFGHDSVVVPVVFLDRSGECLRVFRLTDHLVAT